MAEGRYVLQVQLQNVLHNIMMPDQETGEKWLAKLARYVGRPRFHRNDDEPHQVKIAGVGCAIVVSTDDGLYSVALHDRETEIECDQPMHDRLDEARAKIYRRIDHEFFERLTASAKL